MKKGLLVMMVMALIMVGIAVYIGLKLLSAITFKPESVPDVLSVGPGYTFQVGNGYISAMGQWKGVGALFSAPLLF